MRYGAPAGTPYGCGSGPALASAAWATPAVASPTTVSPAGLGVSDPAYCYVKELDVQESAAAQTITVNGVAVVVPALPPPNYPSIIFKPSVSYTFSVSNLPGSPLQGVLQFADGSNVVTATCTFKTTLVIPATATTPAGEQAVFTCIPAPPPH